MVAVTSCYGIKVGKLMNNMTAGSISKHLVKYTIPLILGNFFQLTYNAVDSIIVGRYAGKEALAAVGTANPVMNIMIFFVIGICLGASVLMSEFFGAGDKEKLKKEVATTLVFGAFFILIISFIGILLSRSILSIMGVPDEILSSATSYLQIILMGLIFTFFYNAFAAALKSIGDSKTPLIFLAIAAVLNGCLDMVFVAGMGLGVTGAATATVIAEAVSAILCVCYIYKKVPLLSLKLHELRIETKLLRRTIHYAWATALQQSCLYIGKLLIQGVINPLGIDAIATFNAVNRVDDFAFTPQQSIAQSVTTFVAQNRGAKKKERIMKGFHGGIKLEMVYWVFICAVTYFGAVPIMRLFATGGESQIIVMGTSYLHLMAIFYLLPAFTNVIQGFFRGMGNMKITLISTTVQMIFRVLAVVILAPRFGMTGVAYACLIGWVAMLLAEVPYYIYYKRRNELLQTQS